MKISHIVRLMALSIAVSGCAAATTTTNAYYPRVGLPEIFRYAAVDRDFLTEIYGNPSTASKTVFDASVIAAMRGNARGLPTNFTTNPSANAREGYRMVMVFSGDPYFGGAAVCGDIAGSSLKPIAGRVEVQAAFCYKEDVLSLVHVAYAKGSPAMADAITQVVLNLFPLNDPNLTPGSIYRPLKQHTPDGVAV